MQEGSLMRSPGRQTLFTGGMLGDAALGGAAGHGVAQQLAEWINTANTTAYDKAIDSVYLSTHVGGSQLHHLLDGQHDIFGAFEASARALPDDTLWQELMGTAGHLGKDLFSVSGLPVISLDPAGYASASSWLQEHLFIPKHWLGDLLQINGLELFAGVLSSAAVVMGCRQADVRQLAELASAGGLAGVLSANPIGLCAAVVALAMACKVQRAGDPALQQGLLVGAGTAGSVALAGAGLTALGLGGGLLPALGAVALSETLGMYVRRFLIRAVGGDASPATPHERPHWHFPSSQELDRLVRSLVESIPGSIAPDISSAINARLSASI